MKKIISMIIILLTLTGCVKMEVNMEIRKDKSMTLGIIQAINKSLMDEGYSTSDILEEEEKNNLEENGFRIESYSDNEMEYIANVIDNYYSNNHNKGKILVRGK